MPYIEAQVTALIAAIDAASAGITASLGATQTVAACENRSTAFTTLARQLGVVSIEPVDVAFGNGAPGIAAYPAAKLAVESGLGTAATGFGTILTARNAVTPP